MEEEIKKRPEEISIEALDLSVRAYNSLSRNGIKNISELLELNGEYGDLLAVRSIGTKIKNEIIEKVHNLGFKFKYEIEQENESKQQEVIKNDSYSKLDSQILMYKREIEKLNMIIEKIDVEYEKLVGDRCEGSNNDLNQEGKDIIVQFTQLLEKQKSVAKSLEEKLRELREIEKEKRQERAELQNNKDNSIIK